MTRSTKDYYQYISAVAMILSGIILSFISFFFFFFLTNGVLWYTAQALTFAGGIFGISLYFRTNLGEFKSDIKEFINTKLKQYEKEHRNH